MSFKDKLQDYKKIVDEALLKYLPKKDAYPQSIHESIHYSMFAGGKRLRPILAMVTYQIFKDDYETVLPAACALEMMHTFSLIHDDLPAMDDDDFRRGNPTNHKVYGEAIAVLAGDALSVEAFKVLADTGNIKAVSLLAEAIGVRGVIGGQVVDIESEGKPGTKEVLDYIHYSKTAALIKASIQMGALYANVSDEEFEVLGEFGKKIGLIFQIVDDILDITSTTEVLGKDVGSDVERGKLTYPSLYGLEESQNRAKSLLEESKELLNKIDRDTSMLQSIADYFIERIY